MKRDLPAYVYRIGAAGERKAQKDLKRVSVYATVWHDEIAGKTYP